MPEPNPNLNLSKTMPKPNLNPNPNLNSMSEWSMHPILSQCITSAFLSR